MHYALVALTLVTLSQPVMAMGDFIQGIGTTVKYELWDKPWGEERDTTGTMLTTYQYTGQRVDDVLGIYYYRARWYDPELGRFIQADSIVPEIGNPLALDRYAYVYNNPLKYTDPSGQCVFAPPFDTIFCLALFSLLLAGDSVQTIPEPPNYPQNVTEAYPPPCPGSLANCFTPVVDLMDFTGRDEENPIPNEELEELLDKVAEDLYTHDVTSPGYFAGRGTYDTPFYNAGGSGMRRRVKDPAGLWPADQQVCIEGIGCSGRSDINYFAQGMWSAASGEGLVFGKAIVYSWKLEEYLELPSDDALFWFEYGYNYYFDWVEEMLLH